jgi:hypothetical protein
MTFDRSVKYTQCFTLALCLPLTGVIAYHAAADEQIVHELAFVALIAAVGIKTRALIRARIIDDQRMQELNSKSKSGLGMRGPSMEDVSELTRESLLHRWLRAVASRLSILLAIDTG